MIYLIPLISIGIARAMLSFNLPDIKPFNCQSCLSFWTCVILCAYIDYNLIGLGFIAYLFSDLILIYENK